MALKGGIVDADVYGDREEIRTNGPCIYRGDTLTFTMAVVQQQTNPPPPSPE
jgi:hypothetical protein